MESNVLKNRKNIILKNDIFLVRIITENVSRTSEKEYRGERKLLISAIYNCFEMHWNLKIEWALPSKLTLYIYIANSNTYISVFRKSGALLMLPLRNGLRRELPFNTSPLISNHISLQSLHSRDLCAKIRKSVIIYPNLSFG